MAKEIKKANNEITKVIDRNGDERIIKRSKLKIITITLLVLIILSLIGVGIYFIVKSVKTNKTDEDNWTVATIEEVRDDILDSDPNDPDEKNFNFGVFFYKDDSRVTNFMLRDNTVYEDGEKGLGVLSEVMAETGDEITWYGVEIPEENNELIETLLTTNTTSEDEELEEYIFYDEFEYLGAGSSLRSDMWIINSLSGTNNDGDNQDFEVDDNKVESFSLQVQTNDIPEDDKDNENYRDVMFVDSSTGNGGGETTDPDDGGSTDGTRGNSRAAGVPYSIQEGTTMFFNGTQLTSVVNSWDVVDISEDDAENGGSEAETRDDYHNDYKNYLTELITHNSEFNS